MKRPALRALAIALLTCGAVHRARAEEVRVRPNQTIADLLGGKARSGESSGSSAGDGSSVAGKLAIWSGVILVGACGLGLLRRAGRRRAASRWSGGGIEVAGRMLLSHRHSVLVLRIGGKRLALGVAGDRLTSLGMWDEPLDSVEPVSESVPEPQKTGGFTIRPQDREAMSAARSFRDSDFLPYRKQVERLRGLLRGLRPEDGLDSVPEDSRP